MLREAASIDAVQTSYSIIERLIAEGIVIDSTPDKQRGKRYEFKPLMAIVRGS
jgi:hypothetical protein